MDTFGEEKCLRMLNDKNTRKEFEEFMKSCPEGVMTKRMFGDLSKSALGDQAEFLSNALFRTICLLLFVAFIFFPCNNIITCHIIYMHVDTQNNK